jgi:Spy/CpxP family protein refolding chaperone
MNKSRFIGLIFALILPLTAMAVPSQMGEASVADHVERMSTALNLTADQKQKVTTLFEAQHAKMKAAYEETKAGLQTILTPDQLKQFEANREKHHQEEAVTTPAAK